MASELIVQTLKGPTSGANANKVIIPSGQTLSVADGVQASDMPSGSVIQTAYTIQDTFTTTTSNSYTDIFPNATLTLKGDSKVLVIATISGVTTGSSAARVSFMLKRDSSNYDEISRDAFYTLGDIRAPVTLTYMIPASTAGTTHTFNIGFGSVINGDTVTFNAPYSGAGMSTLVVQEIAG